MTFSLVMSYQQALWNLTGNFILHIEELCATYDSQLKLTRKRFLDYITLTIHYTQAVREKFIITHVDDLDKAYTYITVFLLWP